MLAIDPTARVAPERRHRRRRRDRPLLRDRAERRDRRRLQARRACACRRPHHDRRRHGRSIRSPRSARRRSRCTIAAGRRGSSIGARLPDPRERHDQYRHRGRRRHHDRRRRLLPDGRRACRRTTARSATTSCSPTTRCSAATVEIGDNVFLGGHCAVHQFTRIGESAMVAGYSALREDVIPYRLRAAIAAARLAGINVVGMRRRGVSAGRHPRGAAGLQHAVRRRRRIRRARRHGRGRVRGRARRSPRSSRSCAAHKRRPSC